MGDTIRTNFKMDFEDKKIMEEYALEILFHSASRMSNIKDFLGNNLGTVDQKMIDTCKLLRETSPFVLDQDFNGPEFNVIKPGTPETAYMISRLKGIPIITNSKTTQNVFMKDNLIKDSVWSDFIDKINNYNFKIIPAYGLFFENSLFRNEPLFDLRIKKIFLMSSIYF